MALGITFNGEHSATIDAKGRMNFPTKFRELLGASFFVTKGIDSPSLTVYSLEEWEKLSDKLARLPESKSKNAKRFLFGSAEELIPDKQGRVLIPQHLRKYASLEKDVIVTGALNTIEIWSKSAWDSFNDSYDGAQLLADLEQHNI
ncbi:MAG: division/cell wall cluster transcriptional repressor MraZ [Clostridia bacterium]|nr:division/cell wall cluster transcriptional repressor MraZ [Ruminococcus sp.]MBQ2805637.1 division/cell wall cluster transcriptional repressor MraZ [Clostridia bacterium]MBQ8906172.1 division/cell wall cluster transcriptional repressor MraZ [Ruminococcus sp.]